MYLGLKINNIQFLPTSQKNLLCLLSLYAKSIHNLCTISTTLYVRTKRNRRSPFCISSNSKKTISFYCLFIESLTHFQSFPLEFSSSHKDTTFLFYFSALYLTNFNLEGLQSYRVLKNQLYRFLSWPQYTETRKQQKKTNYFASISLSFLHCFSGWAWQQKQAWYFSISKSVVQGQWVFFPSHFLLSSSASTDN